MKGFRELVALVIAAAIVGVEASEMDLTGEFAAALVNRATPTNLQPFTGALGGISASPITNSGDSKRPFEVEGNTFTDFPSAGGRACSVQKNDCASLANSGKAFTVSACDTQLTACNSAVSSATVTSFAVLTSSDANFDYFCDP